MSALAFDLDYGPAAEVAPAPRPHSRLHAVRGTVDGPAATALAPTLDTLVGGTWSALAAGAPTACPMCSATLRPHTAGGRSAAGGTCGGCGTTLT